MDHATSGPRVLVLMHRTSSGNVASTCTSRNISGTPSMTSSASRTFRPASIKSATERPSRAPSKNERRDHRSRLRQNQPQPTLPTLQRDVSSYNASKSRSCSCRIRSIAPFHETGKICYSHATDNRYSTSGRRCDDILPIRLLARRTVTPSPAPCNSESRRPKE